MTELLASRYVLDGVIGQGAMGTVWRAHDTVLDRAVALKELQPGPGIDREEAKARFLVEARAAARLRHPNIVAVHDVLVDGERLLISMELIEGPTLGEVVARSGPQSPESARAIMAQVAHALAAAHAGGVVHRDLKPDNIFWAADGRVVVADFGLARIGAGSGTTVGMMMGTPGYMAPEQLRGHAVGPAVDVFGWGVTAYELLAGRPPFGHPMDTEIAAIAYRVVHESPEPLVVGGDPALARVIDVALSKDPALRPADGSALVRALEQGIPVGAISPTDVTQPTPHVASADPPTNRAPLIAGGVTALIAVIALVVGALVMGGGDDRSGGAAPVTTVTLAQTTTVPSTTTTSTTTTTVAPVPLPDQRGAVAPGVYVTRTTPPLTFKLGEGWSQLTAGRGDEVELARDVDGQTVLSFIRMDRVYAPDYVPEGARDPAGATIAVPTDVIQHFAGHPRLTVTDRRSESINGRTVVSAEIAVTSGYRHATCERQSLEGLCVHILPIEGARFLLASGNRNRVFVFRGGDTTVVAIVEARPDAYDQFLATVRAVLATLTVQL